MCGEGLSVQFLKYGKAAGFPLQDEREVLEKVVKCAPNWTRTETGRILRQLLLLISTGTLGINSRNLLD